MRISVVMLALSLALPAGAAAQAQTPAPAPARAERHTLLPQHKRTLSVDFGVKKALKSLPQHPIRCDTVRKHRSPLATRVDELAVHGARHILTAPVTPCPVR